MNKKEMKTEGGTVSEESGIEINEGERERERSRGRETEGENERKGDKAGKEKLPEREKERDYGGSNARSMMAGVSKRECGQERTTANSILVPRGSILRYNCIFPVYACFRRSIPFWLTLHSPLSSPPRDAESAISFIFCAAVAIPGPPKLVALCPYRSISLNPS